MASCGNHLCRSLLMAIIGVFLACLGCERRTSTSAVVQASGIDLPLERDYESLLERVYKENSSSQSFNGWSMSSEHLFVNDATLADRIVLFDRKPGALDLFFGRILDARTNPKEILAISQMLVFYAEWNDDSDQSVKSKTARNLLSNLRCPSIVKTIQQYPHAGVERIIEEACRKAVAGRQVLSSSSP